MAGEENKTTVRVGGLPFKASEDQAAQAVRAGGKVISEQEALDSQAAQNDLTYVDQNWGTAGKFAAGVGSGLTLGLGPGLASQMGLVDPNHLQAAQADGAYTAGDVLGTALPSLFTGGESALARGLSATPAGLLEAGGSATERLLGGVFTKEAGVLGKMASRPLQMAARGAFDGAAINLGHTVGDALIQNKPLSAESLLASGADGALFGGLMGSSLGVVGALGSQAVDSLGALGKSAVGRAGVKEGVPLKRLGLGAEDVASAESKFGSRKNYLSQVDEVLKDSGTGANLASSDKALHGSFQSAKKVYSQAIQDVATELDARASTVAPSLERIEARLDAVKAQYTGTLNELKVVKAVDDFKTELQSLSRRPEPLPKAKYDFEQSKLPLHERTSYENYLKTPAEGAPVTWEKWIKSRDQLEASLSGKGSNPLLATSGEIRTQILDTIDSELGAAMRSTASTPGMEGLAEKYAAAHTKLRIAEQLEETIGKKAAGDVLKTEPMVTPRDIGSFVGMAAIGHPVSGLTWLAAKGVGKNLQGRLEPAIAQMAFESSIGTKAAGATQNTQSRIKSSVGTFFKATSKGPYKASQVVRAEGYTRPKGIDRKAYEEMASRTEQLTSANHQEKVRRYAEMLESQGYGEFANALMATNNRAVQYLIWNAPARAGTKGLNSLRPMPASKVPTLEEYKYFRQVKAISDPFSLLDDMNNNSLSRDAVAAVKYVYPEIHAQIAESAAMQIYEMKSRGEFLPMSKIATLGVALDSPIDSTLQPDFVNSVQVALNAPPPQEEPPPPEPAQPMGMSPMAQDLMTPLQQILS